MTRKEAKSRLNLLLNEGKNPYELVDVIYDEFDSKRCDNCKHINIREFSTYGVATCINTERCEMVDCYVSLDFVCNQWEKK